jgi:hypothetical protein
MHCDGIECQLRDSHGGSMRSHLGWSSSWGFLGPANLPNALCLEVHGLSTHVLRCPRYRGPRCSRLGPLRKYYLPTYLTRCPHCFNKCRTLRRPPCSYSFAPGRGIGTGRALRTRASMARHGRAPAGCACEVFAEVMTRVSRGPSWRIRVRGVLLRCGVLSLRTIVDGIL